MESLNISGKLAALAGRYRHALLVLLIGLVLMILPLGSGVEERTTEKNRDAVSSEQAELEQRLSAILSRISGAGEVEVLLTERSGKQIHYQTDIQSGSAEHSTQEQRSTVIVESSDNDEQGLVLRTDPPVYLGAVVVCRGADDPKVKLAIVEAVRCATGLGADQISVIKMQ